MPLTPNHANQNRSYVLPDGTILAFHKDAWMPKINGGDISEFGFKTTNNYYNMWNEKDVYDTTINF